MTCLLVLFQCNFYILEQHIDSGEQGIQLVSMTLSCLENILSWDFVKTGSSDDLLSKRSKPLILPIEFQALMMPQVSSTLFRASALLFNQPALAMKPLACLIPLSGIQGAVLDSNQAATTFLTHFIHGVSSYLEILIRSSSNRPDDFGDKVFSVAQIAKNMFYSFPLSLVASISTIQPLLRQLCELTVLCISTSIDDSYDTWLLDAGDDFLIIWSTLVEKIEYATPEDLPSLSTGAGIPSFCDQLAAICGEIVNAYVSKQLQPPSIDEEFDGEDLEEKDYDLHQEQLINIAILARVCADDILGKLLAAFQGKAIHLAALFHGSISIM